MPPRSLNTIQTILALASTVTLAIVGAAGATAGPSQGSPPAICAAAALRAAPLADASVARASTLHSYDDYIEDVVSAPDVCSSNFVTNDNQVISIGLHIHDRAGFSPADGYSVFLDTDSNIATGSLAGAGVPAGAEYEVEILEDTSALHRWDGSAFERALAETPIATFWLDGYGPALTIDRRDLRDVQAFDLVFVTSNGADVDLAPDSGMWSYALSPLALTAGQLALGQARAGKSFRASIPVERSDFELALEEGQIKCVARVGGKPLAGKGAFIDERVACTWRVPRTATGKRVTGSVSVTFQGVTAKRAFSVRVR